MVAATLREHGSTSNGAVKPAVALRRLLRRRAVRRVRFWGKEFFEPVG